LENLERRSPGRREAANVDSHRPPVKPTQQARGATGERNKDDFRALREEAIEVFLCADLPMLGKLVGAMLMMKALWSEYYNHGRMAARFGSRLLGVRLKRHAVIVRRARRTMVGERQPFLLCGKAKHPKGPLLAVNPIWYAAAKAEIKARPWPPQDAADDMYGAGELVAPVATSKLVAPVATSSPQLVTELVTELVAPVVTKNPRIHLSNISESEKTAAGAREATPPGRAALANGSAQPGGSPSESRPPKAALPSIHPREIENRLDRLCVRLDGTRPAQRVHRDGYTTYRWLPGIDLQPVRDVIADHVRIDQVAKAFKIATAEGVIDISGQARIARAVEIARQRHAVRRPSARKERRRA
jgi:hypothetical protein